MKVANLSKIDIENAARDRPELTACGMRPTSVSGVQKRDSRKPPEQTESLTIRRSTGSCRTERQFVWLSLGSACALADGANRMTFVAISPRPAHGMGRKPPAPWNLSVHTIPTPARRQVQCPWRHSSATMAERNQLRAAPPPCTASALANLHMGAGPDA